MSDQTPDAQPDNVVVGEYVHLDFRPGGTLKETLTLAADRTFQYESEDQIEGSSVDPADGSPGSGPQATQTAPVSGRWTYEPVGARVDLLVPAGSAAPPFTSLTYNGDTDLIVSDPAVEGEGPDGARFSRSDNWPESGEDLDA